MVVDLLVNLHYLKMHFYNNSGFPTQYNIPGGNSVDYSPLNEVDPYCGYTITENTI